MIYLQVKNYFLGDSVLSLALETGLIIYSGQIWRESGDRFFEICVVFPP